MWFICKEFATLIRLHLLFGFPLGILQLCRQEIGQKVGIKAWQESENSANCFKYNRFQKFLALHKFIEYNLVIGC